MIAYDVPAIYSFQFIDYQIGIIHTHHPMRNM